MSKPYKNDQLKLDLITKIIDGEITIKLASTILGKNRRTISRYVKEYKKRGSLFLIHGNTGRQSTVAFDKEKKKKVLNLIAEKYFDFTVFHAYEKLKDEDLQFMSYKTLLRWCHEKSFIKKVKHKRKKVHRARSRMPQKGLLLQMDGSFHNWFGNIKTCLIGCIDDADNSIPYIEFFEGETTLNCMKVIQKIIEKMGVFKILYVDRAGVFGGNKRTSFCQLEEACKEMGIQIIYAYTAQAKGRIERLWRTLQDRLIPELRLKGITELDQANDYLQNDFIPDIYNKKFLVRPSSEESQYTNIIRIDLQEVFSIKHHRQIKNDQTFSFNNQKYQIITDFQLAKSLVEIREYYSGDLAFFVRGLKINVYQLDIPTKVTA